MSKIRTHYDNLKVTRNAPDVVIKAAHKALLQMHHPDKATDKVTAERITRIINEAREVLLDPVRRKQHDDWIKEKESHQHRHNQHDYSAGRQDQPQSPQQTEQPASEQTIGKYVASDNGTAIDTETCLMWCRFSLGQIWHNGTLSGHAKTYSWHAAFDAVKAFNEQGGYAGYGDWRLPTIDELKTLVDKQAGNKADALYFIDNRVFLENPLWLWSSSPYAGYGGGAWFVYFRDGEAFNEDISFARAVRLVRNNKTA